MNKLAVGTAFLALLVALVAVADASPVSAEDLAKYFKENGVDVKQFLKEIDIRKVDEKAALLNDDDDDETDSQFKEKLINFINKVDKFVKKMNPKKFYEEKVKKNKYYKFFFGDDEELADD